MFAKLLNWNSKNWWQNLVSSLIIFSSVFGFLNLPALSLEQSLAKSNTGLEALTSKQETTVAKIEEVEIDEETSYKFGQRIEASKFKIEQIKNDICGQNLINTSTLARFDPQVASTIIKVVKTKCPNSNFSQTWLKLVWDNGLIGWVEDGQSSQNLAFENLLNFGSVQTFAEENKKTCKDFDYQIWDLKILNQFPNLDLDDDGVGCEHLPIDPKDQIALNIADYDTDKNGKITCADFDQKVYDSAILGLFPNLDADQDGIGCEANKVNPNFAANEAFDPNSSDFVDIENLDFELNLSSTTQDNFISWQDLSTEFQTVINKDLQELELNPLVCSANPQLCLVAPASLAGFGKRGLWLFHFITGLLQGAGQSITDLMGQIWKLITDTGDTLSSIWTGLQSLLTDPKIILPLIQDFGWKIQFLPQKGWKWGWGCGEGGFRDCQKDDGW